MLRNSAAITFVLLLAATLLRPVAAEAGTTFAAGSVLQVQYIPNDQAPGDYEMDTADHMSWMKAAAVPIQSVTIAATATLTAGDLSTNRYVYRSSTDAGTYDQPANPDNLSTYHFMQGAQYVSTHGDLDLAGGQQIGMICEAADGQMLIVFAIYIQGATHTFAAWISAGEWMSATIGAGMPTSC